MAKSKYTAIKKDINLVELNQSNSMEYKHYIHIGFNGYSLLGGNSMTEYESYAVYEAIQRSKIYNLLIDFDQLILDNKDRFVSTLKRARNRIKSQKIDGWNDKKFVIIDEFMVEFSRILDEITHSYSVLNITSEMESNSRYGNPYELARYWYWKDDKNHVGFLRAVTEMEAIDRLREMHEDAGKITWISVEKYTKIIAYFVD